jgi:uncharacterized protein YbbC (DUF1343 family)
VKVITGAQRLAADRFVGLAGRRVGLIANHTTRAGGDHLADLIHAAPHVTLGALFGPEHGLRGTGDAGEEITDGRDAKTGVPVYSLYGGTKAPTQAMLKDVDVLIFDIQDIGARFYTYISTMGLAMQAAARADIPFMVLDRPNPLGGAYVAGFSVHKGNVSFVSQFAVPQAHGLTVGELARMIKGERLLPGLEKLALEVVAMEGWRRDMLWPDTGLLWVATSPAIPDFETALIYPGTGFFEATPLSEGRGTDAPFRLIGALWADGEALADTLNARALPGVKFEPVEFTPERLSYMSADPKLAGEKAKGVRVGITDPRAYLPVETGVHLLHAFRAQARKRRAALIDRPGWLAKLAGTSRLNGMLRKGLGPERIIAAWDKDRKTFLKQRAPWLLYR